MKERANKTYHVVVTAIDGDTGIETEEVNDTFNGFMLLADAVDGEAMAEIIMNENIMNLAALMCTGNKTKIAVRLANMMLKMEESKHSEMEDLLMSMIGGIN